MRLIISDLAEADLEGIADYIASDNPRRALTFVEELRQACSDLLDKPLRYPLLDVLPATRYRRRVYGRYAIISLVEEERVLIVRVLSTARDIQAALDS